MPTLRFISEITAINLKPMDLSCPKCSFQPYCRPRVAMGVHAMCELPDIKDVLRAAALLKWEQSKIDWISQHGGETTAVGFQDGVAGTEKRSKMGKDQGYQLAYTIGRELSAKLVTTPM